MFEKEIKKFIDDNTDNIINDVISLCRIDSSNSDDRKPFGRGSFDALEKAAAIMEKSGLSVEKYDGYGVTGSLKGENDEPELDILVHADVVPGNEGWTVTKPFEPVVKDGKIYGRGTADDKGPAAAAIYAVKAVGEICPELKKTVRIVIGGNEEMGGEEDLKYIFSKTNHAKYSVSPDADYPVINAERGHSNIEIKFKNTGRITNFKAGKRANMIPAAAEAEIKDLTDGEKEKIKEKAAAAGAEKVEFNGGKIIFTGVGGHASTPEIASNAILISFAALSDIDEKFRELSHLFPAGDCHGKNLGVDMKDDESGEITVSFDMLNLENGEFTGVIDSRTPKSATKENFFDVIREKTEKIGVDSFLLFMSKPHIVNKDSFLVKTLLSCYEKATGKKAEPVNIGGGTYVHNIENGVGFGIQEPGTDERMHGPDEFVEIENLKKSVEIYFYSILEICGK